MKTDPGASRYVESGTTEEFDRSEIRKARYLLRRLRFLETSIKEKGGMLAESGNGGGVHAEMEMEALEWALGPEGVSFITIREGQS